MIFANMVEDPFDKAFLGLMQESTVTCKQILHEFESAYQLSKFMVESEGQKRPSLLGYIQKFIGKIIQTITDFVKMIGDIFNIKGDISPEEYYRSGALNERFNSDYAAIDKACKKELVEGHRLIQKIASATGVDDSEVQAFVARASKELKGIIPIPITGAIAWGTRKGISAAFKSDKQHIEEAGKAAEKAANNETKMKQIQTVISTMNDFVKARIVSAKNLVGEIRKRGKNTTSDNTDENNDGNE